MAGGRPGSRREDDFDPNGSGDVDHAEFPVLDRNRDNRISASEWYYAPEYFRRADRDRNGFLTRGRVHRRTPVWDDDRDDSFENLDANKNGRVERASGTAASMRSSGWIQSGQRAEPRWRSSVETTGAEQQRSTAS